MNFGSFPPGGLSVPHVISRVSLSSHLQNHNLTSKPTAPHSSQHLKGKPTRPNDRPPFAHLTSSPNTCASYVQGQDHSPSVTGCAISQSPTAYDLTTSQTSSKCPDDYTNHQLRTAACSQLHDPGVKVRPAFLFIHLLLTSPLVLRSLVREGLLFLNGKFSHL